jgi:hypothetical protein
LPQVPQFIAEFISPEFNAEKEIYTVCGCPYKKQTYTYNVSKDLEE